MCLAGFAGVDTFHVVFPVVVERPRMLGIMAGMALKDSHAAGVVANRTVFTSVVDKPWVLGVMACIDQKDSYGWCW